VQHERRFFLSERESNIYTRFAFSAVAHNGNWNAGEMGRARAWLETSAEFHWWRINKFRGEQKQTT
jgi:hypothetical protein